MIETCKCGRAYHPKQRWVHEPLCRYVDEVEPNHVKPENRFAVETETVETGVSVDIETGEVTVSPWSVEGVSRATYFRRKKAGGVSG